MAVSQRVVVTGLGTVNAVSAGGGATVAHTLAAGHSGIGPVRAFDVTGCTSQLAGEVDDAILADLVGGDAARRLSRICRLTVAASRLALDDAGASAPTWAGTGLGLVVGTEYGDFRSSEEFASGFLRRGIGGLSPMIFPNTVMNAMGAVAAIVVGARGPTVTVNQATVAGDLAVARGAAFVAAGHAVAVLAGGVDELCAPVYRRLAELGVLSPMSLGGPEGCRPFLPEHNGPVIGEGATFLVLEALDAARARGATIHAEIRGGAWSNIPVAPHTAPRRRRDPGSPVRRLLARLELPPSAIARSYGSGNGDPDVDDWEMSLLAADLSATPGLPSAPHSLAPLFGQHSGLGVLRAGAAALDCRSGLAGPVLVHGIARGGCRTALMLDRAA